MLKGGKGNLLGDVLCWSGGGYMRNMGKIGNEILELGVDIVNLGRCLTSSG